LYEIPKITATGVARMRNSSGSTPIDFSGPKRNPSSARTVFQARTRSKNEVKNGAITMKRSRVR
jgi:hypothetical protein